MASVQDQVWQIIDGLKSWQLDLVRRILQARNLTDDELSEVTEILLTVLKAPFVKQRAAQPVTKEEFAGFDTTDGGSPKILRLFDLEKVSAVQKGQSLSFAQTGMTIIFGDNAAGKSSYARVLKQSCRTVDDKVRILPNIYAPDGMGDKAGSAKIEVLFAGDAQPSSITRQLNSPPDPRLRGISIFDSKCGSLYLTGENEVAYVPNEIGVLQQLVLAQDRMKSSLQERVKNLKARLPNFVEFTEETRVRQLLRDLSHVTDVPALITLATFSEDDRGRLESLEAALIDLNSNDPTKAIAQIRTRVDSANKMLADIRKLLVDLSDDSAKKHDECARRVSAATAAVELARANGLNDELVPGVGSSSWKVMWQAARTYYEHEVCPGKDFPPSDIDSRCPLCHQQLSEEASERLKRFDAFILNAAEQELKQSKEQLEEIQKAIGAAPIAAIENAYILPFLKAEEPAVHHTVLELIDSSKKRQLSILGGFSELPALLITAEKLVQEWVSKASEQLSDAESLQDPNRKEQLVKEIAELKARSMLSKRINDARKSVEIHTEVHFLDTAIKSLSTTAMTSKISELTETAVTAELEACLDAEIGKLRCGDIPVRLGSRGAKGQTKCKLALKSTSAVDLAEILSQGEQRALSLAFFLAEIGSARHDGTIILDDPISSLDHLRRSYVAERLVAEAANRQTIIFTHDIVFLLDLQSTAEKSGVPCTTVCVRRTSVATGIASPTLPWIAQKCKDRLGYLKNELQKLTALERAGTDPDRYEREIKTWYELLREAWERGVEERLFGGVVERFRNSIETKRLERLNISASNLKKITDAMTNTSAKVHDEAAAVHRAVPSPTDAEADLKEFEDFLSACPPV
ncbi:AAA family ATPase [Candidatus Obscuribacterales bacterium]|nr:AAA family ATPase [Candidatus Obscuribacterales bacterium]MBX3153488.1 AAA family ATPase [Candidatus Obscuribacterales bacterium]